MAKKLIVIGGSAAGPKAAARARRMDQSAEITILQEGEDFSMASCGYPYYVGGVFDNRNMLLSTPTGVVRDPKFFLNAKDINAVNNARVEKIDTKKKTVQYRDLKTDTMLEKQYDKLIIATGANPFIPNVPGMELEGVTTFQSMKDADYLRKIRDEKKIKKAIIVGGGLIGIETCEALELAGISITVVELLDQVLGFLDKDLALIVENHIKSKGANIIKNNGVASFIGANGKLKAVKLQNGTELECELAVIAIGVRPNTALAADAGLKIGDRGGIIVDDYMQTSDKDIYAIGDCVEIKNLITEASVTMPMGDLANLEGRVAGENAVTGNKACFRGTVGTAICKIFDVSAGSSGLSVQAAEKNGLKDIVSVVNASPDKPGFMNAKLLISKMIVDEKTRRIIGYQCVGPGDVSKQIATAAMAIQGGMTVEDLVNLDLPYAPPYSLAIDHFIAGAHIMQNKLAGLFTGISCAEVKEKTDRKKDPIFLLDARGPDEYEQMRLGIGETLIPLGALRKRLNELPADKNTEIICYCKISLRGYEAARVVMANGYKNVKVMEGGIMAWPYPREK
ncbi:MAG: FAD-dependent oxidoreductase [Spirochaetales bacterium]|nr:FAD-dependent oxidoreductase [Spirochaetales bacterium]